MPAMDDSTPPILSPLLTRPRPAHPSPRIDGLSLEVISGKEAGYWGHVFGVDIPYTFWFTGWGEVIPNIYGDG